MRVVAIAETQPQPIRPQSSTVWICRCGLSRNGVFCDGSHTSTMGEQVGQLHQYHGPALERTTVSVTEACQNLTTLVCKDDTQIVAFRANHKMFDDVVKLRTKAGNVALVDRYDTTAHHFLYRYKGKTEACMRVNFCRDGSVDCEVHYPTQILSGKEAKFVGSASGLVKRANSPLDGKAIRQFILAIWQYGLDQGIYADLINCTNRMVTYYRRLGYRQVLGSDFTHPRLGTDSVVMLHLAHPLWPSRINDYLSLDVSTVPYHQLYSIADKLITP